jgi:hypothetical protein
MSILGVIPVAGHENEPYSSSFAPLLRQKTALMWSTHQVAVAIMVILWYALGLALGSGPFTPVTPVQLGMLAADLLIVRRMSVWQLLGLRLGLLVRRASGRSGSTVSPLTADSTVGLLDVPGLDGSITPYRIVNSHFAGAAFVWDARRGEATALLRVSALSAQLVSSDVKTMRAQGFSAALHALDDRPDVTRVTIQARSLRRPIDPSQDGAGQDLASRDLIALEAGELRESMRHDYILGVTVDPGRSSDERRRSLGLHEVGNVLCERVTQWCGTLLAAGVDGGDLLWLNAQQLRGEMKSMTDPDAYALLDAQGRLADDVPVATSWREYDDHMSVGPCVARTLWVDRWPERDVPAAWLGALDARLDLQLVFTLVLRMRGEREAKRALERQLNEADTIARFNTRLGRQSDRRNTNESWLLAGQLHENAVNGGDIQFQGFATVISPDIEHLDNDCRRLMASTAGLLHFDRMRDQQLRRWIGALPLGLEGRDA